MKINPEYVNAGLEMRVVYNNIGVVADNFPLRFRVADKEKAFLLMQQKDWKSLKDLSIAPALP